MDRAIMVTCCHTCLMYSINESSGYRLTMKTGKQISPFRRALAPATNNDIQCVQKKETKMYLVTSQTKLWRFS